jgi:hypothetical protein
MELLQILLLLPIFYLFNLKTIGTWILYYFGLKIIYNNPIIINTFDPILLTHNCINIIIHILILQLNKLIKKVNKLCINNKIINNCIIKYNYINNYYITWRNDCIVYVISTSLIKIINYIQRITNKYVLNTCTNTCTNNNTNNNSEFIQTKHDIPYCKLNTDIFIKNNIFLDRLLQDTKNKNNHIQTKLSDPTQAKST